MRLFKRKSKYITKHLMFGPAGNQLVLFSNEFSYFLPLRLAKHQDYWNMKKTFQMVVKGKTQKPVLPPLEGICRKNELKLIGVILNENSCNWDTQFENMMNKASSRPQCPNMMNKASSRPQCPIQWLCHYHNTVISNIPATSHKHNASTLLGCIYLGCVNIMDTRYMN